jgi:phosphatidylserine decarboxylase
MLILNAYFVYFFRDPVRVPPQDPSAIVAAAEGVVTGIVTFDTDRFRGLAKRSGLAEPQLAKLDRLLAGDSVRFSIYLSPLDVHVNRAPFTGEAEFLGYFPGKHLFTLQEKSSEENQHNAILIESDATQCLIHQIVGPVCRRVVYWPDHDKRVPLTVGDKIGMMKFGSRLDMYLPKDDIDVLVKEGDRVRAGETRIAALRGKPE